MIRESRGSGIITLECTQEQADRWNSHVVATCNMKGTGGKSTLPRRVKDVVNHYNRFGSISQCARNFHMGRDTVKRILKSGGVLT